MHIFVAGEHPPIGWLTHAVVPFRLRAAQASCDIAYEQEKGHAVNVRNRLLFYTSSKGRPSLGQLMNRAAAISDGGAAHVAAKLRH